MNAWRIPRTFFRCPECGKQLSFSLSKGYTERWLLRHRLKAHLNYVHPEKSVRDISLICDETARQVLG